MLDIMWLGNSYEVVRSYSKQVKRAIGFELHLLQHGKKPMHARSMKTVGRNVWEIRVSESEGEFRVFYVTRHEGVYVLNVFEKKAQKTPKHEIELAQKRFKQI